ncbi:bifunctional glycosyltransferase 87/phosphatase PAP2 family protein [Streptomyces sp. NPDC006879]|uniref:bifunctional glycosyltransferase 87/phosphatase PAP2 family protein n=1 Tax=Streptomyces sp. NPDC006879 TaxID=3364767 RepID=UPI0036BD10CE
MATVEQGGAGGRGDAGCIDGGGPGRDVDHAREAGRVALDTGGASRPAVVRAGLWLVVAALAVRQVMAVASLPSRDRVADLASWIHGGPAAGTPFAGLVLKPLARPEPQAVAAGWTLGTLLLVALLAWVAVRALPAPVSRRTESLALPAALVLLLLALPVRSAFSLGQIGVIPVLLVLLACFHAPSQRVSGLLIGCAAALQPALLLFAPLFWCTGRREAARTGGIVFAAGTVLAAVAMPRASWTYWIEQRAGTGVGGRPEGLANQSLHGALLRLGLSGPLEIALFVVLAGAVCWFGLRRAVRYARDGQLLLAVALTGCVAVAVSPVGWRHQMLWLLLATAGRVGRRAVDRPVWPVAVVLAMTLPSTVLLPNLVALAPVRDNVLLLVAVAAACAVPFLERGSAYWQSPVPKGYAVGAPGRWSWVPLLPFWRRVLGRPNLLLELLLIRVGYSLYSHIRAAATGGRGVAEDNGRQIVAVERALGIDIEHAVNAVVVQTPWLKAFFNFYYTSFHFVVPLAILAVLYWRRPADYRWARASLGLGTVIALFGFWLYPLAPPRLMPGLGFVDTVHGPQDLAHPQYGAMTAISNQYAAMPSLHFGWSLWCGIVIVLLAPRLWQKTLGLLHPLFTVCAIVATANHWVLDAVGGAVVIGCGFVLVHVLSGPRGPAVKGVVEEVVAQGARPDVPPQRPGAREPGVTAS